MRQLLYKILFIFFLGFILPQMVFAAQLFFEAKTQNLGIGQEFRVDLLLSAENEELNAVEGNVVFPGELVELKEIRDGNSIINFWVERPKVMEKGRIVFSGITPGGYKEAKGFLFSAVFEVKKEGAGAIEIQNAKALLNDGEGNQTKLSVRSFSFVAIRAPIRDDSWVSPKDTEPPEKFKPEISRAEDLFYGKYFLVFATQDKGSGIGRYEVREGFWSRFAVVESPYLLQNQKLDKKIFVKAVDKAGNERTEILYSPNFRPWYKNYWIFGILIIMVIIGLWLKFIKSR